MNRPILFIALACLFACEEAPLFSEDFEGTLNAPVSFQVFPGSNLALVANSNINIQEPSSSLIVYDISAQSFDEDSRFQTQNFTVRPLIDEDRGRVLIPDLDEYLRFFTYTLPGQGASVSFEREEVSPDQREDRTNAIEMDDLPSDVVLVDSASEGPLYLVLNQLGTITVVEADTLTKRNLNDDDRYEGLRLTSALTIDEESRYPARGASRFFTDPATGLLYIANPSSNFVYLFNPERISNEGVISFLRFGGNTTGIRSITFDDTGRGYFLHGGLSKLVVVDVSGIFDNGIDFEVIEPLIIDEISLFGLPNEVVLNDAQDTAYVSLQDRNEIISIDLATLTITARLLLSEGTGPATLFYDASSTELLTLDFFSDSLTRIDATNLTEIEVIP